MGKTGDEFSNNIEKVRKTLDGIGEVMKKCVNFQTILQHHANTYIICQCTSVLAYIFK